MNVKKMRIPVFVSCPSSLNPEQQVSRDLIENKLEAMRLEPRTLGQSDYAQTTPLKEVVAIAQHCSGGLILGFSQLLVESGVKKPGVPGKAEPITNSLVYPTPWNHLEAGILFALGLPLLVFREHGISGGIFDEGMADLFINRMPTKDSWEQDSEELQDIFLRWRSRVSEHYYRIRDWK